LAGNQKTAIVLDISNGKVTIDKFGNVETKGTLFAKEVQTEKLTIDTSNTTKPTAGSAFIQAGASQITIQTTAVEPEAKILVTAKGPTGGNGGLGGNVFIEGGMLRSRFTAEQLLEMLSQANIPNAQVTPFKESLDRKGEGHHPHLYVNEITFAK